MNFSTSLILSGAFAISALSAMAQNEATVSISPAPGDYEVLPSEFVLTIDGPSKIAKNITGGNPLLLTSPSGATQQLTGTVSGNTVSCKLSSTSTFPLNEAGEYKVTFRNKAIKYTWPDGTPAYNELTDFYYNVAGEGGGESNEPQEVVYDIELQKTVPSLKPLDLEMKTIETLQIYFNMGNLEIASDVDATVTISGPNYKQTTILRPNMVMETATCFKALFTDPEYNGTYTLTIPEGILGDKTWIENHEYGHANAAVNYEFTVEGGKDPSEITVDLTFNPFVNPTVGTKVGSLSEVSLLFDTTPYWNADTELKVGYKADPQSLSFSSFTTAKIEKGEGNEVKLVLDKKAVHRGEYSITLPEGTFWNADHETDVNTGSLNSAMNLYWNVSPVIAEVNVTSHVPATDAKVASFPAGQPGIIINTDNNDAVAELSIQVVSYALDSDSATPVTLISTTSSTEKTEDGAPCWVNNTGADIPLSESKYYEVTYSLLDADGNVLADGLFEFYGDYETGINSIESEKQVVIYNLQGIRIDKDANALPAGFYIINGKNTLMVK